MADADDDADENDNDDEATGVARGAASLNGPREIVRGVASGVEGVHGHGLGRIGALADALPP